MVSCSTVADVAEITTAQIGSSRVRLGWNRGYVSNSVCQFGHASERKNVMTGGCLFQSGKRIEDLAATTGKEVSRVASLQR